MVAEPNALEMETLNAFPIKWLEKEECELCCLLELQGSGGAQPLCLRRPLGKEIIVHPLSPTPTATLVP